MACGAQGRFANAENLLSECGRFLLNTDQATAMIADMERIVTSEWYTIARAVGICEADCSAVSSAYGYPGFCR